MSFLTSLHNVCKSASSHELDPYQYGALQFAGMKPSMSFGSSPVAGFGNIFGSDMNDMFSGMFGSRQSSFGKSFGDFDALRNYHEFIQANSMPPPPLPRILPAGAGAASGASPAGGASGSAPAGGTNMNATSKTEKDKTIPDEIKEDAATKMNQLGYGGEEAQAIVDRVAERAEGSTSKFNSILGDLPPKSVTNQETGEVKENDNWGTEFGNWYARSILGMSQAEAKDYVHDVACEAQPTFERPGKKIKGLPYLTMGNSTGNKQIVVDGNTVKAKVYTATNNNAANGDDTGIPNGTELYKVGKGGKAKWYMNVGGKYIPLPFKKIKGGKYYITQGTDPNNYLKVTAEGVEDYDGTVYQKYSISETGSGKASYANENLLYYHQGDGTWHRENQNGDLELLSPQPDYNESTGKLTFGEQPIYQPKFDATYDARDYMEELDNGIADLEATQEAVSQSETKQTEAHVEALAGSLSDFATIDDVELLDVNVVADGEDWKVKLSSSDKVALAELINEKDNEVKLEGILDQLRNAGARVSFDGHVVTRTDHILNELPQPIKISPFPIRSEDVSVSDVMDRITQKIENHPVDEPTKITIEGVDIYGADFSEEEIDELEERILALSDMTYDDNGSVRVALYLYDDELYDDEKKPESIVVVAHADASQRNTLTTQLQGAYPDTELDFRFSTPPTAAPTGGGQPVTGDHDTEGTTNRIDLTVNNFDEIFSENEDPVYVVVADIMDTEELIMMNGFTGTFDEMGSVVFVDTNESDYQQLQIKLASLGQSVEMSDIQSGATFRYENDTLTPFTYNEGAVEVAAAAQTPVLSGQDLQRHADAQEVADSLIQKFSIIEEVKISSNGGSFDIRCDVEDATQGGKLWSQIKDINGEGYGNLNEILRNLPYNTLLFFNDELISPDDPAGDISQILSDSWTPLTAPLNLQTVGSSADHMVTSGISVAGEKTTAEIQPAATAAAPATPFTIEENIPMNLLTSQYADDWLNRNCALIAGAIADSDSFEERIEADENISSLTVTIEIPHDHPQGTSYFNSNRASMEQKALHFIQTHFDINNIDISKININFVSGPEEVVEPTDNVVEKVVEPLTAPTEEVEEEAEEAAAVDTVSDTAAQPQEIVDELSSKFGLTAEVSEDGSTINIVCDDTAALKTKLDNHTFYQSLNEYLKDLPLDLSFNGAPLTSPYNQALSIYTLVSSGLGQVSPDSVISGTTTDQDDTGEIGTKDDVDELPTAPPEEAEETLDTAKSEETGDKNVSDANMPEWMADADFTVTSPTTQTDIDEVTKKVKETSNSQLEESSLEHAPGVEYSGAADINPDQWEIDAKSADVNIETKKAVEKKIGFGVAGKSEGVGEIENPKNVKLVGANKIFNGADATLTTEGVTEESKLGKVLAFYYNELGEKPGMALESRYIKIPFKTADGKEKKFVILITSADFEGVDDFTEMLPVQKKKAIKKITKDIFDHLAKWLGVEKLPKENYDAVRAALEGEVTKLVEGIIKQRKEERHVGGVTI